MIFKTKADYFKNPIITIDKTDSFCTSYPSYFAFMPDDYSANDGSYYGRIRLDSGYILAVGRHDVDNGAYLAISFDEYEELVASNICLIDTFKSLILDADPFIEYYRDANRPRIFEFSDTVLINEIIKNGELELYFKRLK